MFFSAILFIGFIVSSIYAPFAFEEHEQRSKQQSYQFDSTPNTESPSLTFAQKHSHYYQCDSDDACTLQWMNHLNQDREFEKNGSEVWVSKPLSFICFPSFLMILLGVLCDSMLLNNRKQKLHKQLKHLQQSKEYRSVYASDIEEMHAVMLVLCSFFWLPIIATMVFLKEQAKPNFSDIHSMHTNYYYHCCLSFSAPSFEVPYHNGYSIRKFYPTTTITVTRNHLANTNQHNPNDNEKASRNSLQSNNHVSSQSLKGVSFDSRFKQDPPEWNGIMCKMIYCFLYRYQTALIPTFLSNIATIVGPLIYWSIAGCSLRRGLHHIYPDSMFAIVIVYVCATLMNVLVLCQGWLIAAKLDAALDLEWRFVLTPIWCTCIAYCMVCPVRFTLAIQRTSEYCARVSSISFMIQIVRSSVELWLLLLALRLDQVITVPFLYVLGLTMMN